MDCLLCCETQSFIGIGACGHQPFCYKCIYKLRVVTKDNSCPICKENLDILVITNREGATFLDLKKQKLLRSNLFPSTLFDGEQAKRSFEKLTEVRCFVPKCEQTKGFTSIAFLKKHLKEKHNRYLCDICIEHKRCVLQEQKLYSYKALQNHQKHGDYDQFGNLIFLHPYCSFCNESFFDQQGLKKHLGKQHYVCNTCPDTYKYTFYKDYKSLQIHFKMTHYLCPEVDCLAKGFIVFKTNSDLVAHKYIQHQKNATGQKKTKDMTAISGFYTESTKIEESKIKFHDKEGKNFEDQFISLKKSKNRGFNLVEQQEDGILDFRPLFKRRLEEDEIYNMAFDNTVKRQNNNKGGKKQQYRQKGQKIQKEQKKQEGQFVLEDLHLVNTTHMPAIQYKDFERKVADIFTQQQFDTYSQLRHGYNKKKISSKDFLEGFVKLFPSRRQAYNIFPQYIRTIQNQSTKEQLDLVYLQEIKKLPKKVLNLINSSNKYSDFMIKLTQLVEKNLETRIMNGSIDIRKTIKIDKARIFQMIEVLRHMRAIDMVKLKFASNFSIMPETIIHLEQNVFMLPFDKVNEEFSKLTEIQFLYLYLYVKFCRDALQGKKIHLERQFIKQQILEPFLEQRPDLQQKYGKRKESMTLEEQAAFEELEEKKKIEKLQQKTFTKKNVLIDTADKYQFPQLIESKKEEQKKVFDPKANISNQEYKQKIVYQTKKVATRQKNLNQYFPSIGEAEKQSSIPQTKIQKTRSDPPPSQPAQKNWWDKVSGKVEQKVQQGKIIGQIGRKKKRGKQVIEIQGGFR